jgi:DNA-binding MarR family transcriptional regulator
LNLLTHASGSRLDAELIDLELASFQYAALSVLVQNENFSSSRLSRRFQITPQAMGELMLLLERRGLIERREDATKKKANWRAAIWPSCERSAPAERKRLVKV